MQEHKESKRTVSTLTIGLMWSGIAISVAEIWAGGFIGQAGLVWGLVIIVVGHALGGLVMSAAGCIGTRYGVMSMESTRLVLGNRGSTIPSVLNVLQLVGWATIMLALSGAVGASVGKPLGGVFARKEFWIILIGAGTLAWSLLVGEERTRWLQHILIGGLLALSVVMTFVALNPKYYTLKGPFLKSIPLAKGASLMDFAIVMPISWAPLIADYSRMARSEKGAFWSSFGGYGIMSIWMYVIGLVVFLATGTDDAGANVVGMMGKVGLAIPAMILVFASTVTSDFPDIYSSACSMLNIDRRIKPVYTMWATGLGTIVLALFFDLSKYMHFLELIGAVFVPLFALLLTEYFVVRRQRLPGIDFATGKGLEFTNGFRLTALAVWVLGAASFFTAKKFGFILGGSVTSFAVTAAAHLAVVKFATGGAQPEE
ncbi:MAG: cytosine permease [Lentisphaeria bacterium]|nr:cytosine permease [Lentisphaeria bacterium]